MAKKKSKGLGDDIEKITKATGIKRLLRFSLARTVGVMSVKNGSIRSFLDETHNV